MESPTFFLLVADIILLLHVLLVVFVVLGFVLIFVGKWRQWLWVRHRGFRITHLLVIAVIVVQSWFGIVCPLTTIEMALRARVGDAIYTGSFISHWLETILYYQAPVWVFVVCYTVFGVMVVGSWFWVRPRPRPLVK
ncbi:hypothetical protein MNBD_GAMMA23-498 [hydrothermal vent metagenome]|uniref:DUF2784 domain-containing protein n=1 Tax=hydrothermal vent metagenome TaxID=652676 RepID=A0A3B1AH46_9ZZZZ